METNLIKNIPDNLIYFALTTVFSLLIGLSQRKFHEGKEKKKLFGTDRTFTFIGIFGFITYIIQPQSLALYIAGGIVIAALLGINYTFKILNQNDFGLTTIIIALLTYGIAPLVITQPPVVYLSVIITMLVITEMRETFKNISQRIDNEEFVTLSKFLIIAGIILPLVPNEPIFDFVNITPFKIWLAVVVISSISYMSYILKKYFFKNSGIFISGVLGGLYSSTATTLILSKKARHASSEDAIKYASAIIIATTMMYLRILVIILIFNQELFFKLSVPFVLMALISGAVSFFIYRKKNSEAPAVESEVHEEEKNPLEFKVALIFTALYIAFTFITYFTIKHYGTTGLTVLSLIVGATDIDPFLINLFQGKYEVATSVLAAATFQAIISNNVLKFFYSLIFSGKQVWKKTLIGFLIINLANLLLIFLFA